MSRTTWLRWGFAAAVIAAGTNAIGFDEVSSQRRMFGTAKKLPSVSAAKPQTFNFDYFVDAAVAVHADGTFTIDQTEPVYPTVTGGPRKAGKKGRSTFKATDDPSFGAFTQTLMQLIIDVNVSFTTTKSAFTFTEKNGQVSVKGKVTTKGTVTSGANVGRAFSTSFSFKGTTAPPM